MLRRKLLIRVGILICAFVVGAVAALAALQHTLGDIDRTNADAAFLIDGIQAVGAGLSTLDAARLGPPDGGDALPPADPARRLREAVAALGVHPIVREGGAAVGAYRAVERDLEGVLAVSTGPTPGPSPNSAALGASLRMHRSVEDLGKVLRAHVAAQQRHLGRSFRSIVLVLTLAALVMVNVAVHVLLRTAGLVLRPVEALVAGSRELAAERFEHRVRIAQQDEFGELAHAYNQLAERLQASEERKAESLRQLAVTLNHELNNALSIIELQLALLDRQADASPARAASLREIRAGLARMARTVSSLKHIRRVVLTDYAPGQKMVDLERSVADPPPAERPPADPPLHAAHP